MVGCVSLAKKSVSKDLTVDDIREKIKDFLEDQYYEDLRKVAGAYPEKRSLYVDWNRINDFDEALADELIRHPDPIIKEAERVIQDLVRDMSKKKMQDMSGIHFRVEKLPESSDVRIDIRNLRAKDIGRLVAVVGLVRKITEVRPRIITAAFRCMRCDTRGERVIYVPQTSSILAEPLECPKKEGGCGRTASSTTFLLLPEFCTTVDSQKIDIQELPDEILSESQPQRLTAVLEDDIAGVVWPGRRVVLNGVVRAFPRGEQAKKRTIMDLTLEVVSVEPLDEVRKYKLSEEDIKEILDEAKKGNVLQRISKSIAPTLYGLELEKTALALQMFGGVSKSPDGMTHIRGDIHILLVGDPSTGKSQLLSFIADVSPRATYATGRGATAAGLTAAAVKDEFGEGRWTLEAGALVMADRGLAAIDELDKMSEQDRSGIHEALEQQRVSIAKAGINATLYTRCALLGAANPKRGRIEDDIPFSDQINLPLPLLQRFDAIFVTRDIPDPVRDSRLAEFVVKMHRLGEMKAAKKAIPKDALKGLEEWHNVPFKKEKLRKYIQYAKENIFPVMNDKAASKIRSYYEELRRKSSEDAKAMLISPRHLEGIIRFSEASARARLSREVEESDVDLAIKIFEAWIMGVSCVAMKGGWDVDSVLTGLPKSIKGEMEKIKQIISDLDTEGKGVPKKDIIEAARKQFNIPPERADTLLQRLLVLGELHEPEIDRFRRIQY